MVTPSFSRSKGISGGHNWDTIKAYLDSIGEEINIVERIESGIDGVYEIKYQVKRADGTGFKEGIKTKTFYDSSKFTDAQMLEYGKQAMQEGLDNARIILTDGNNINNMVQDTSENGIKFIGYINKETGIISNFHPVSNF